MTDLCRRRAQCSEPSSLSSADSLPAGTRAALGSSTAARALSTREPASFTAALTPTSMTGLPAKRSRPLTGRSWAKMTALARLMSSGSRASILPEPWPSMATVMPRSLPACSRASAAMKVWAMPVGQEETPTMTVSPSAGADDAAAALVCAAPTPAAESAALPASPASLSSVPSPPSSSSGWTCCVTIRVTSSASAAWRRASVNSVCMSPRASLARSWRWKSSAPSGAAIMKMRSAACPSAAPKSTGCARRAKPRLGARTWGLRQCGMAMPPGIPVGAVDSRFLASAARPSGLEARPAPATVAARNSMTSSLPGPASASSATSSGMMRGLFSVMVFLGVRGAVARWAAAGHRWSRVAGAVMRSVVVGWRIGGRVVNSRWAVSGGAGSAAGGQPAAAGVCGQAQARGSAPPATADAPAQESRVTTAACSGRSAGVGRVVPGREAAAEP